MKATPIDWTVEHILPSNQWRFDHEEGGDWLVITWGGYDYEILMSRIPTPLSLLRWIAHLGKKSTLAWTTMTPCQIALLIEDVCKEKGWNLYGSGG